MLTNLTLENFKAFQKLDDLKIKPITILCGTNSCGKSSILQSILLLKQTLESQNPNQNLLLNGRFVKLGSFQDVIFKKNIDNKISFNLTFQIEGFNLYQFLMYKKIENVDFEYLRTSEKYMLNFIVDLKAERKDNIDGLEYLKAITVEKIMLIISPGEQIMGKPKMQLSADYPHNDIDSKYDLDDEFRSPKYTLRLINEPLKEISIDISDTSFSNLFPSYYRYTVTDDNFGAVFIEIFSAFKDLLQNIFQTYSYIGPLRGEPERRYIYEDEELEIGNRGENAAYLYLVGQRKNIWSHYFYNSDKDKFEQLRGQTLQLALRKWFDLMKIPNFEAELNNKIIYLNMEASAYDETRVGIADVGFGVSQIFPIILEGLRMEKGSTLMLEQPEIHLHPNLQMQMADYFISLALSGKQVLVETHSDHVINRLVRRIVEDETHNLKDLIGIYFIKPSENGSVYEEVKIDETKGIVNWPPDFFDQTANEQMKIMQAGLKKRKNQRIPANGKAS